MDAAREARLTLPLSRSKYTSLNSLCVEIGLVSTANRTTVKKKENEVSENIGGRCEILEVFTQTRGRDQAGDELCLFTPNQTATATRLRASRRCRLHHNRCWSLHKQISRPDSSLSFHVLWR